MGLLLVSLLLGASVAGISASPTQPPSSSSSSSPPINTKRLDMASMLNDLTNATAILDMLMGIKPTKKPTTIEEAQTAFQAIYSTPPSSIYDGIAQQLEAGLLGTGTLGDLVSGLTSGENSHQNTNSREPEKSIYPQSSSEDAPFSVSENDLRAAIFIPPTFTYGKKQPVIFMPGTGAYGGINFASNIRKLLNSSDAGVDPVWVNVPDAMLADAQTNAEYMAYAVNYIAGISGNTKVSVISWSQGGLSMQWAFAHWPSTRSSVRSHIAISPDFHGTVLANALCLNIGSGSNKGLLSCDPSVTQQEYTSKFVAALRRKGGDSAYVPTTSIYSGLLDEVVQPQSGTNASAYLLDNHGVGVSNNEVTQICKGKTGGSFYGHAGVMYNPLTYALVLDALTHDGPGDVSRLDLNQVCSTYAAPGLGTSDVLNTMGLIPIAGYLLLTYDHKSTTEPELKGYATLAGTVSTDMDNGKAKASGAASSFDAGSGMSLVLFCMAAAAFYF